MLARIQNRCFIPIMLGAIVFFIIMGGEILNPTNIAWLKHGDPAQHWLGWQFFRSAPLLQWPLGAIPNYGMELSSTIVFTDSIPLLAFIFKPFHSFLPEKFQYFGLWLLLCFILQSYFSWKILSLFTKKPLLPIVGSLFFTLAPIYLYRLYGHYALVAHWELLGGLFFYFSNKYSLGKWILILAIASLTHAYMLLMVLAIFGVDLIQRYFLKELTIKNIFTALIGSGGIVILIMWATGYFVQGSSVSIGGYGFYRMNLLSLIDSNHIWSTLFPDIKGGDGELEGFNYLGLGIMFLLIAAGYTFLKNFKIPTRAKFFPLLFLSLGLFLYAISNQISFGGDIVISYSLPLVISKIFDTFRASGRFFWPVYYLIYLWVFFMLFNNLKSNRVISICILMLIIQVIDLSTAYKLLREKFTNIYEHPSLLKSPLWDDFAKSYKQITYVLPEGKSMKLLSLFRYASENKMTTNMGIYARTDLEKLNAIKKQMISAMNKNEFKNDALYVFGDDKLWKNAIGQLGNGNFAGEIDEYKVLAPNFLNCTNCNNSALKGIRLQRFAPYKYIKFGENNNNQDYLIDGWSESESWGVWSDGYSSLIKLEVPAAYSEDVKLLIEGDAFLTYAHSLQEIDVLVNNHLIKKLVYIPETNHEIKEILIPSDLISEHAGKIIIQLKHKNPQSPFDQNFGTDKRILSLGIISLSIELEKALVQ